MFMLLRILILLFILVESTKLYADDIPVIVIAPSKKAQSISTVGTTVTVLDEKFFKNTNEMFLGDVLAGSSTSINFFQNGGAGTTSGIQLRGLPKRYSTVYIDGIKMSDPSNVSNDFDFNNILTSQISRVEILKGTQSSVYGSGAIGGTVNITTKKGKQGFHKDISYTTGSHGTHNLNLSLSGADEKNNFYVGVDRYQTDGISQVKHNDEDDRYRNNSLVANYAHKISDKLEFETSSRVAETYLQYDALDAGSAFAPCNPCSNTEEEDGLRASSNVSLKYSPNKQFNNKFTLAKSHTKRVYQPTVGSGNAAKDIFVGDRHALLYSGNYNFSLDNSVTFGLEREDDQVGRNKDVAGLDERHVYINSSYFDVQSRLSKNIYATFGSRFDDHNLAGTEDSHRTSFAYYLFDNRLTKLKTSYGTGFRYPSIFELYHIDSGYKDTVKAENSTSFDFGVEHSFLDLGLGLDVSYFKIEYDDTLEGWEKDGAYKTLNHPGDVRAEGVELVSKWKKSEMLNFLFNYTYSSTYDGADHDNSNKTATSFTDTKMVAVPRHAFNLVTAFKLPGYENLDLTLKTKYSDTMRDYGSGNKTFNDVSLDDFLVNDLSMKYNYLNSYNLFFDINNILDEGYETRDYYNQLGRTLNFGIKKSY